MIVINRKLISTICLALGTFMNPFGYDILVYKLTQLTNGYWNTIYVLYGLASLSFLLSYLFYRLDKKTIGDILITLALFLNPFGYDIIVYIINTLTGSYWMTMSIMYMLSISFYSLFIYFSDFNIITHAKNKHDKLKIKFKKNG